MEGSQRISATLDFYFYRKIRTSTCKPVHTQYILGRKDHKLVPNNLPQVEILDEGVCFVK